MPNEWVEWNGGEQPVPNGTLVDVEFRCGDESGEAWVAESYDWFHCDEDGTVYPEASIDYDIVRYRIHD